MDNDLPAQRGWLRRLEVAWACLTAAWFLYTVLVWWGILGMGNEWRPAQTAWLSGVIAITAVTPVIGRRIPWLGALSMAAAFVALFWYSLQPG